MWSPVLSERADGGATASASLRPVRLCVLHVVTQCGVDYEFMFLIDAAGMLIDDAEFLDAFEAGMSNSPRPIRVLQMHV